MNQKTDDRPFLACFLMLTQTAVSPLIDSFLIFQMDFVDFSRFSKIYHAPPMHYGVFDLFAHFVEIAEFFRDSQNRVAPLKVLMLIKKKKKKNSKIIPIFPKCDPCLQIGTDIKARAAQF